MNEKLKYCERTKLARELAGLSTKEMSRQLGVEYHAYNKYETRSMIKTHLVGKFCKITGVRPEWLIDGEMPMTKKEEIVGILNQALVDHMTDS